MLYLIRYYKNYCKILLSMKNKEFSFSFSWEENNLSVIERVGMMYCFKMCDVNYN